ncbi:MAG TPA: hypothetical protein VJ646_10625 [Candidatus Binatia bacterium]|nr:hypothetical protein [Candidatus Binatia bacterium]
MQHTTTELLPVSGSGNTDDIANVVFVHGLGGHNRGTWQFDSEDETTFWPQWLYDDLNARSESGFRPVGVWSLGYPAEVFRVLFFSKNRDDSVPQRARNLVDTLVSNGLGNRPIIFVVHSLGGILVKQMLRSSRDAGDPRVSDFPKLALSTRLVIFLATPHTGSSMARLAEAVPAVSAMLISGLLNTIEWLPLGGIARMLARRAIQRGRFTAALESGDPYLEDLGTWYRHNAPQIGIDSRAYYENTGTQGIAVVVDKESANPGVSGVEAIALDADHSSICKPTSRNEDYKRIAQPVRQAISQCPVFKETHLAALDVGERFERLAELISADRMRAVKKVVQPIESRLGRTTPMEYESSVSGDGAFDVADWQAVAAAISPYDLDRIILSVWHEYRGGSVASDPTQGVRHEVELLRQTGLENRKELSLPPLYYAARALKTQKERGHVQMSDRAVTDVKAALATVETLAGRFGMDTDRSTRNALHALIGAT